jgi:DNA-binding MarR family transcriptional regulator
MAAIEKAELTTLYSIRSRLGLSPGVILATLGRLEKAGLMTRAGDEHSRKRVASLTVAGRNALETQWEASLRRIPPDLDSALHAFWLARLMGYSSAVDFLFHVADERGRAAEKAHIRSEERRMALENNPAPTLGHQWAMAHGEYRRLDAEQQALQEIAQQFSETVS